MCSQIYTTQNGVSGINPHHAEKFEFAFVKFVLKKNNFGVSVNSDFFPQIIELDLDLLCKNADHFLDAHFPDYLEKKDVVPSEIKSSHHAECLYLNCWAP